MSKDTIRWPAELDHVRDVSLPGTADLGFWRDRLAGEGLLPGGRDGAYLGPRVQTPVPRMTSHAR